MAFIGLSLCTTGLVAVPAQAQMNPAQGALNTWTRTNPNTGALIVRMHPAGGQVLASYRHETGFIPASTMKVVTGAGALIAMGPEFRYRTAVLAGRDFRVRRGVATGTLYLKGSGDPVLATGPYGRQFLGQRRFTDLGAVARALRTQGIRQHAGAVVVDSTVFDRQRRGLSWLSHYGLYATPLSGAAVNQNHLGDNRRRHALRPDRSSGLQLRTVMRRSKLANRGAVRTAPVPNGARQLATVESPRLGVILRSMNPSSDNFVAEMLRKSVGAYAGTNGSTAEGNRVTTMLLRDRGILGATDRLVDGSGLSRANRLSANTLVSVFEAGELDRRWGQPLVQSLPRGGTGTLARRFREPAIRNRVFAKTGYINGVSSLTGVVVSPSGKRYAFALLMNTRNTAGARATQDRLVRLMASGRLDSVHGQVRIPPGYGPGARQKELSSHR